MKTKKLVQNNYKKLYEDKCKENEILQEKIKQLEEQVKSLNINKTKSKSKTREELCSINGSNYEIKVHDIVKNCKLNGKQFNTQNKNDLGGSKPINDLECNFKKDNDIGIEIKKFKTPDWIATIINKY